MSRDNEETPISALTKWMESIFAVLNNLVDDVIRVQTVKSSVSVIEAKLEFFTMEFAELKQNVKEITNKSEKYVDRGELDGVFSRINNVDANLAAFKLEQAKSGKEKWIQHGKMIAVYSLIIYLLMQLAATIMKNLIKSFPL